MKWSIILMLVSTPLAFYPQQTLRNLDDLHPALGLLIIFLIIAIVIISFVMVVKEFLRKWKKG